jgi:hypothetical protein
MDLTQMEGHKNIFFSKDAPVFGISWEAKHTVVLIGLVQGKFTANPYM